MQMSFREFFQGQHNRRFLPQVFVNFALSISCAIIVVLAVAAIERAAPPALLAAEDPDIGPLGLLSLFGIAGVIPIIETLMLAGLLRILSWLKLSFFQSALLSGTLWGLGHGMFDLPSFFSAGSAFFVFSCAYLSWRRRSFFLALAAAAIPHMMQNSIVWGLTHI